MAIVEDASAPAVKQQTGTAAAVTASFTPVANSLVVVMWAHGWGPTSGTPTTSTLTSSPSTTWTVANSQNGNTQSRGFAGVAYHYFAASPGAMTITATPGNGAGSHITVKVLTGASSSQTGANAGRIVGPTPPGETTFTHPITTTTVGSLVYGQIDDSGFQQTHTANANSTIINQYANTVDAVQMVSFKASANTVTPGAITLGTTSAGQSGGHIAMMEVLPLGAVVPEPIQIFNLQAIARASQW